MFLKRLSRPFTALFALLFTFLVNSGAFAVDGPEKSENKSDVYKILAFGDSLTAGYGLPRSDGFVPQLSAWLNSQGLNKTIKITNAGVSGDTTSGGKARLAWNLAPFGETGPDLIMVGLGGNDGLRGVNPKVTRENMTAIVQELKKRGVKTLLLGMMAPPNLGEDYAKEFNSIYPDLKKAYGAELYPFFLDGVAADKDLNQADGIHPNKKGVTIIVGKVGPIVKKIIEGGK